MSDRGPRGPTDGAPTARFDPKAHAMKVAARCAELRRLFVTPLEDMDRKVRRSLDGCAFAAVLVLGAGLSLTVQTQLDPKSRLGLAYAAALLTPSLGLAVVAGGALIYYWLFQNHILGEPDAARIAIYDQILPQRAEAARWRMMAQTRRDFRLGFRKLLLVRDTRRLLQRGLLVRQRETDRAWGWSRFLAAFACGLLGLLLVGATLGPSFEGPVGDGRLTTLIPFAALTAFGLACFGFLASRVLMARIIRGLAPEEDAILYAADPLGDVEAYGLEILDALLDHRDFTRGRRNPPRRDLRDDDDDDDDEGVDG